jgi:cyclic pyranopterin phosphate synthase
MICLFIHIDLTICKSKHTPKYDTAIEKRRRTLTLKDPYNRPIKSLRISLTQQCDFNCFFCHQEGEHDSGKELSPSEIEQIAQIASEQGIKHIKLTGGEPLVRKDIVEIVKRIKPYVEEVSMTTNASKLSELACKLKEVGLARVNVSLHTFQPSKFKEITGTNLEKMVEEGIREAIRCGLTPVKLNMVVMKGVNHDEIENFIDFSSITGAVLQLIEFQELQNGTEYYDELHYDLIPVEEMLEKRSKKVVEREMHRRKIYFLRNGAQVEVVRPMHNSTFCAYCTRLRVTSDGKLKACLMRDDNHVPFISLIREGKPHEVLVDAFREAVSLRQPYWKE